MLTAILSAVVLLGALVFVHELGHFVTAKMAGIYVSRFSLGLGPKLVGFKRGETEYVLSAIPLGGYVQMLGMGEMATIEGGEDSESPLVAQARLDGRSFKDKSLAWRALVIVAGVAMNVLLAIAIFAASGAMWGVERVPASRVAQVETSLLPTGASALAEIETGEQIVRVGRTRIETWMDLSAALLTTSPGPTRIVLDNGERLTIDVPDAQAGRQAVLDALYPALDPVIGQITRAAPAAVAGLQPGDRILNIAGDTVRAWQDVVAAVRNNPAAPLIVEVWRDDNRQLLSVTPEIVQSDSFSVGRVGMAPRIERVRLGALNALSYGLEETWYWTRFTGNFLAGLVRGEATYKAVGGPIMITQMSGAVARAGLETFLRLMALLSINLAVINIMPVPVLDGGHLLFLGVEAARGRPLGEKSRMRAIRVGMVVLVLVMTFAVGNDILRIIVGY